MDDPNVLVPIFFAGAASVLFGVLLGTRGLSAPPPQGTVSIVEPAGEPTAQRAVQPGKAR